MLRFIGTLAMAIFFASCALSMAQTYEKAHNSHIEKIKQAADQ